MVWKTIVILCMWFRCGGQTLGLTPLELVIGDREKREIVSETLQLRQAQAERFWTTYESYERARRSLRLERIELLKDLQRQSPAKHKKAHLITKRLLLNKLDQERLYRQYFQQFKKVISTRQAAAVIVIDRYFQNELDFKLNSELLLPDSQSQKQND